MKSYQRERYLTVATNLDQEDKTLNQRQIKVETLQYVTEAFYALYSDLSFQSKRNPGVLL